MPPFALKYTPNFLFQLVFSPHGRTISIVQEWSITTCTSSVFFRKIAEERRPESIPMCKTYNPPYREDSPVLLVSEYMSERMHNGSALCKCSYKAPYRWLVETREKIRYVLPCTIYLVQGRVYIRAFLGFLSVSSYVRFVFLWYIFYMFSMFWVRNLIRNLYIL